MAFPLKKRGPLSTELHAEPARPVCEDRGESLAAALARFMAHLLRDPTVTDALRKCLGGAVGADVLVPLAEAEIETKAARGLERRGLLRIVKIGRRAYIRRSELLSAFDKLAQTPREPRPLQIASSPKEAYAALVELTRSKRAAIGR